MDEQRGGRALAGPRPTLASDADRDEAARRLGAAFAEGRLDADEHGERVRAAYAARTWQDLDRLTADLPGQAPMAAAPGDLAAWRLDKCLMCALFIACPPAGIIWLLMSRARSRTDRPELRGTRAEDH
jgi:Domain of unknown function (DUF1707)